jgi:multisubunit Na+/H+ antiporter MnhB subunit
MTPGTAIDGVLGLILLALAWRLLAARELFQAVVLFIAFGLVMALAWARLGAPDLALAEAAIGAGVTGALFLAAIGGLARGETRPAQDRALRTRLARATAVPLCAALAGTIIWAAAVTRVGPGVLAVHLSDALARAGATNPVTAVLLDLRAYDTLLEVGVVLVALAGAWSLRRVAPVGPPRTLAPPDALLDALTRLVAPVSILLAGYLWWAGAKLPGGAFQAGAVLAAAIILLLLSGRTAPARLSAVPARVAMATGLWVFLAAALAGLPAGRVVLAWPPALAYALILLVEAALTIAIALVLASLFVDAARTLSRAAGDGP